MRLLLHAPALLVIIISFSVWYRLCKVFIGIDQIRSCILNSGQRRLNGGKIRKYLLHGGSSKPAIAKGYEMLISEAWSCRQFRH